MTRFRAGLDDTHQCLESGTQVLRIRRQSLLGITVEKYLRNNGVACHIRMVSIVLRGWQDFRRYIPRLKCILEVNPPVSSTLLA